MRKIVWQITCITIVNTLLFNQVHSQGTITTSDLAKRYNPILTAVPFILIAPDSRAGGMGDQGVATEADVWSMHWNPAKYTTATQDFGLGLSYTPWLRNLGVKDVSQAYLSGYKKLDNMEAVALSLLYFNLGTIYFTDYSGQETGQSFAPREITIDGAYSRKLSNDFSLSLALRYIYSNLTGNAVLEGGAKPNPAQTGAADISGYYVKEKTVNNLPVTYRLGFNISNLGGKVSYLATGEKEFLPTSLRLGAGANVKIDQFNELGLSFEATKLLVPSPQYTDSVGGRIYGSGDPQASVPSAMIHSFYDAPGGAIEEWHEITWGVGGEYWYMRQFALRGGFFYENEYKGNRKYFTFGLGLRMTVFGLDAAYVVPVAGNSSPLANTWRMSLTYNFDTQKTGGGKKKKALAPTNAI